MDSKLYNILILEDDYTAAQSLKSHIEKLGYDRIIMANNSQQALRYFAECEIQVVFLDIGLHKSNSELDGLALAKLVNEKYETQIIFTTSFSDKTTIDRASEVTYYKYLAKPINDVDVSVVMRELVSNQDAILSKAINLANSIEYRAKDLLIKAKDKKQVMVKGDDVIYVTSYMGGIAIRTIQGEEIITDTSLASFMRQYQHPDLIQIHRGHTINRRRMKSKYEGKVELENGEKLDIGGSYRSKINEYFTLIKQKS